MDIFVADCNSEEFEVYQLTEHNGITLFPHPAPNLLSIAYTFYYPETNQNNLLAIDLSKEGNPYPAITTDGNTSDTISWSSDSRYVVYSAPQPDGGEMDIYRVEIKTGAVTNLTAASPVWDAHPQFSPVSDQIVFVSDRYEEGKLLDNLWIMDSDGNNLHQLTSTETWENTYPSWSPDGNKIAFFRWGILGDESEGKPGLIVIDVNSGQEALVVKDVGFANYAAPVWSPDGQFIAYLQSGLEDASHIMVVPSNGGEPVQITDLSGTNYGISWSPDSQWIIFTHQTSTELEIFIVDREGNGLRPLFPGDGNAFGRWFHPPRN
jgi:Tol biopolymer transport system component